MMMIIFLWATCPAHLNPAVTLGVLLRGAIKRKTAAVYVVAQFAGGFAGAGIQSYVMGVLHNCGASMHGVCCCVLYGGLLKGREGES